MPNPHCLKHGKDMIRVNQGFETRGTGWDVHQSYYEEFLCPICLFRLRLYYLIMDVGKGVDSGVNTKVK